jgi:hypothetical protein
MFSGICTVLGNRIDDAQASGIVGVMAEEGRKENLA